MRLPRSGLVQCRLVFIEGGEALGVRQLAAAFVFIGYF
jgi:hypothetical protein